MKIVKLFAAVLCVAVLCTSLSSCGARLFFDEDGNFVGLDNILTVIYGDGETVPVERIEIVNEGLEYDEDDWGVFARIDLEEKSEYQIEYKLYPDDTTETDVEYEWNAEPADCAAVDGQGLVTFTGKGVITVFVYPENDPELRAEITIVAE